MPDPIIEAFQRILSTDLELRALKNKMYIDALRSKAAQSIITKTFEDIRNRSAVQGQQQEQQQEQQSVQPVEQPISEQGQQKQGQKITLPSTPEGALLTTGKTVAESLLNAPQQQPQNVQMAEGSEFDIAKKLSNAVSALYSIGATTEAKALETMGIRALQESSEKKYRVDDIVNVEDGVPTAYTRVTDLTTGNVYFIKRGVSSPEYTKTLDVATDALASAGALTIRKALASVQKEDTGRKDVIRIKVPFVEYLKDGIHTIVRDVSGSPSEVKNQIRTYLTVIETNAPNVQNKWWEMLLYGSNINEVKKRYEENLAKIREAIDSGNIDIPIPMFNDKRLQQFNAIFNTYATLYSYLKQLEKQSKEHEYTQEQPVIQEQKLQVKKQTIEQQSKQPSKKGLLKLGR